MVCNSELRTFQISYCSSLSDKKLLLLSSHLWVIFSTGSRGKGDILTMDCRISNLFKKSLQFHLVILPFLKLLEVFCINFTSFNTNKIIEHKCPSKQCFCHILEEIKVKISILMLVHLPSFADKAICKLLEFDFFPAIHGACDLPYKYEFLKTIYVAGNDTHRFRVNFFPEEKSKQTLNKV